MHTDHLIPACAKNYAHDNTGERKAGAAVTPTAKAVFSVSTATLITIRVAPATRPSD